MSRDGSRRPTKVCTLAEHLQTPGRRFRTAPPRTAGELIGTASSLLGRLRPKVILATKWKEVFSAARTAPSCGKYNCSRGRSIITSSSQYESMLIHGPGRVVLATPI